jgi:hypothetical protein
MLLMLRVFRKCCTCVGWMGFAAPACSMACPEVGGDRRAYITNTSGYDFEEKIRNKKQIAIIADRFSG